MTVKELIEELKKHPADFNVKISCLGCDEYDEAPGHIESINSFGLNSIAINVG